MRPEAGFGRGGMWAWVGSALAGGEQAHVARHNSRTTGTQGHPWPGTARSAASCPSCVWHLRDSRRDKPTAGREGAGRRTPHTQVDGATRTRSSEGDCGPTAASTGKEKSLIVPGCGHDDDVWVDGRGPPPCSPRLVHNRWEPATGRAQRRWWWVCACVGRRGCW